MEVANYDKSVRDAVRVPGHVLPVEIGEQVAKRIARLGDRDVAQRVDIVNGKLPAPCLDRPERRARLGKASVDEPMLPQAVAGPKHQQLFLRCLHLNVLVVEFPLALGKGDDVVAAGPCVKKRALAPGLAARLSGGPARVPRRGPNHHYESTWSWKK